jgi:hypothetical protein
VTGDGGWPMNPAREYPPKRSCCRSKINEYHEEVCANAGLNEKWAALGVIVDISDPGLGVAVADLSGEPMPVRLAANRTWGVRIPTVPFSEATEVGPPRGAAPLSVPQEPSGVYRDLADVYHQENDRIVSIADELVADITGRGGEYPETYKGVAEFFVANLMLLYERNEMAHDAWRATGWAGNLMTLWGKAKRLMNNLWWFPNSDVRREKPLDHFGDTAIYAAFTAMLWMAGDERGAER